MSDDIRINHTQSQYGGGESRGGKRKMLWIVIVAVIVIVVLACGAMFHKKFRNWSKMSKPTTEYQAVFLTNGQVYFGKLSDSHGGYINLTEIYYLQVTQPGLQGSQPEQPKQQPQLSLVKLGNELHGPVDTMRINREHILFYEDIKADGKVAQAIKEYKANPK